ncbi:MAG: MBL fold metallo-hydrolase [Candidatus Diapherotrites archaeon]|nr:MBL fold metallo-hydrolase [Candidatus Diapherotrites archaeon]
MDYKDASIEWLGHDCFKIKARGTTIYTDPFQISTKGNADLILVTHEHYDHCSPADIAKIASPATEIICSQLAAPKLKQWKTTVLKAGQSVEIKGVKISAFPSYNIGKPFHPKGAGIGLLFETAGIRFYLAGDTDLIPEMKELKGKVDVAFLPVDGTYTMSAEEAAKAVGIICPEIAIPMHYGGEAGDGTSQDAERFSALCRPKAKIPGKTA